MQEKVEHHILKKENCKILWISGRSPTLLCTGRLAVVLPSYHEGMSNVLLEAAATGRAVITTDIPGCREAVDNGKSGMLCKVRNSNSLYKAMKEIY
ncbi:MAG: glycosyltransferase [Eubacterium ramulus]